MNLRRGGTSRLLLAMLFAALACEPPATPSVVSLAPGMGIATRAATASPRDVVALLAEWDTAGLSFDGSSPYRAARYSLICWLPAENCQTDEPGWDVASIVSDYELEEVTERGDSADAVVRYTVVGELVGRQLEDGTSVQVWRPKLARMAGRWFVVDPESQRPPAISRSTALRLWAKTSGDSAAIGQLGHRRPPVPNGNTAGAIAGQERDSGA